MIYGNRSQATADGWSRLRGRNLDARATADAKRAAGPQAPRTLRAERDFARSLRAIARHVGDIIAAFPPGDPTSLPTLTQLLERYADTLTPWAERTAGRMLLEVNGRDRDAWQALGNAISDQLRRDLLNAPVGERVRELLAEQVTLIRSLPIEAGQRVHTLTLQGLEDSTRASEVAAEIARSGEVAESRALLIARTETSRTASALTQARAEAVGSEGYTWHTAGDHSVRPSHAAMQGRLVRWDSPPTLDGLTGHAGALPNCRCWPMPVLPPTE